MIVSMGTAVKESIVMIVSSMMKRVWNDMSQKCDCGCGLLLKDLEDFSLSEEDED